MKDDAKKFEGAVPGATISWIAAGFGLVAVSDLNTNDLERFRPLFAEQ